MALSTPASGTSHDDPDHLAAAPSAATSTLWRDAWRRLLRNKLAGAGGVTVALLCLVAIFADVVAPQSYTKANFGNIYEFPSREFPLGTDQLGRDVLSRMIYGARVSMLVGLGSQIIVVLLGMAQIDVTRVYLNEQAKRNALQHSEGPMLLLHMTKWLERADHVILLGDSCQAQSAALAASLGTAISATSQGAPMSATLA
mgnify:CR=1 FL=1